MRYFLNIVGALMWAVGAISYFSASTSIHQILACCLGMSGSVLIGAGCIVAAVQDSASGAKPASSSTSADVIA
jgi:hypothetical protein